MENSLYIEKEKREKAELGLVPPRTDTSKNSKSNRHRYAKYRICDTCATDQWNVTLRPTNYHRRTMSVHGHTYLFIMACHIKLDFTNNATTSYACGIHTSWGRRPTTTRKSQSHILLFTFTRYQWVIKWKIP